MLHPKLVTPLQRVWFGLVLLALVTTVASAQIRINELMASNHQTLLDQAGQADDWIEIANTSSQAMDLAGLYLTDDPNEPRKWQFPLNQPELTVVDVHGYAIVWADNESGAGELHASFKLSAAGEPLALYDSDGQTPLDSLVFPRQRTDISYGRHPDDADQWVFMDEPTPGQANHAGIIGDVADTQFSVDRGFYDDPITVAISTNTPEASIRYTLDGSNPVDSPTAQLYSSPLAISTTTCLRAYAYKSGWRPTNVDTETYLFVSDVINQNQQQALDAGYPSTWGRYFAISGMTKADYGMDPEVTQSPEYRDQMRAALLSLPTVSVVTDKANLFGSESGIYTHPMEEGPANDKLKWERPVSAELFTVDHSKEFHINCGLRLQGGHSRRPEKSPKHAFSLRFRSQYGPPKLKCKLFGPDWPVDTFDTLHLRAAFCNSWIHHSGSQRKRFQHIRDQWMHDTLIDMGNQDGLQGIYVHLYLNGLYWGVYCLHERPDADHYADYNGGDADQLDAVNGDPTYIISDPLNTGSLSDGTLDTWLELKHIVAARDWTKIQQQLDVNCFIDWMIANYYGGVTDIKRGTNWRAAGGGPQRKPWRFYSWDAEHIIENVNQQGIRTEHDPSGLFDDLIKIDAFKRRFADRVHQHLYNNGALTPTKNIERWEKRADEIQLAMIAESARWGDYRRDVHPWANGPYDLYTVNDYWLPEKNRILTTYFPVRTLIVQNEMKSLGLYPNVDAPEFYVDGVHQHGGSMNSDQQFSLQPTPTAIAYTLDGSEPVFFNNSNGTLTAAAQWYTQPFTLAHSAMVKARTFQSGQWSALNQAVYSVGPIAEDLRITKIMYHPEDPNAEFIELTNIGTETINLNWVTFTRGIRFTFPVLDLAPQGSTLVVQDVTGFTAAYGANLSVAGQYQGKLDNSGERLVIQDAAGTVIQDFHYADTWVPSTDGDGACLEVINPSANPNTWSEASAWQAGAL